MESPAAPGLHHREQIADVDIAIEFSLILGSQLALLSQFGSFIHACGILFPEAKRQ